LGRWLICCNAETFGLDGLATTRTADQLDKLISTHAL
jgi:hypothetical protein